MRSHALRRRPNGDVKTTYFPLKGGLNLVDAPLKIPDGMVLGAINYELLSRDGYRRIDGFERFDGQASPSDQTYWIQNFQNKSGAAVAEGDIVEGAVTGATGEALIAEVIVPDVNLATFPEALDNAVWLKSSNLVVTADTANSPEGTLTADTVEDTNAAGLAAFIYRNWTTEWDSTKTHTASIFIKKDNDETRFPMFSINQSGGAGASGFENIKIMINTKTGAYDIYKQNGQLDGIGGVIDYDADYWRVWISSTSDEPDRTTHQITLSPCRSDVLDASTINGDLIGSIEAWGVMIEERDTPAVPSAFDGNKGIHGYYVLTAIDGSFDGNEDLEVSAAVVSESDGVPVPRGAAAPADDTLHAQDAIETQRDKILKVGSTDGYGPVRGVHVYSGDVYAFRDNAAITEGLMWKATSTGWQQVDLGHYVAFTTGSTAPAEGDTLTQGGVTATIERILDGDGGGWGSAGAAGLFVISNIAGGNFAAGAATTTAGTVTLTGAEVANSLSPGGRYEFRNNNFFGTSGSYRMYGVNGVDPAFEFDGSVFVPIFTGNTNDTPNHIAIHKFHLFLTFEKGSLQCSGTGRPYYWAGLGAAEIGCGDELVSIEPEVGGVLAIICRNRAYILHGTIFGGAAADVDAELKINSEESGGIEWTTQRLSKTRYLDDRGFTDMQATDMFGDFNSAIYSQLIEPMVEEYKDHVTASIIVKSKNQIRTFFEDGSAIIHTFNGQKLSGFTTLKYVDINGLSVPVRCTANGENATGTEIMFFGSDDGYLYQMDKGTSFDGAAVAASLILAYNNLKSPSYNKQYKKVVIEAEGASGVQVDYNALYDYSSGVAPAGITLSKVLEAGGSLWNTAIWNTFNWASEDVSQIEGNLDGVGRNIGLQISSIGTYVEPHTLFGISYHYINRKLVR